MSKVNMSQTIKRLQRELEKQRENPNKQFIAEPDKENILIWHFVLMNLDGDYLGGVYLGKLILPIEYPLKPPSLQMVTPNGRFKTDENICMSFTKYHPESWSPLWNIENMITGLISFMLDDKDTQGSLKTSQAIKKQYAANSIQFNLTQYEYKTHFKKYFHQIHPTQISYNHNINKNYNNSQTQQTQQIIFFAFSFIIVISAYIFFKYL